MEEEIAFFTPPHILDPQNEGSYPLLLNMFDDDEERFFFLEIVAQQHLPLAVAAIVECNRSQEREKQLILDLAPAQLRDLDKPERSARAFLGLSRLNTPKARQLLSEHAEWLKDLAPTAKKTLAATYVPFFFTKSGIKNESTLTFLVTTLINLSESYEQALRYFRWMRQQDAAIPNEITYSSLLNFAPTLREAEKWLKEMSDKNIPANEITYSTVIKLCKTVAEAEKWLKEMSDKNIRLDEITSATALKLYNTVAEAEKRLKEMSDKNIPANEITYKITKA